MQSQIPNLRVRVRIGHDDGDAGAQRMVVGRGRPSREGEPEDQQVLRKIDPVGELEGRRLIEEVRQLGRGDAEEQEVAKPSAHAAPYCFRSSRTGTLTRCRTLSAVVPW